MPGLRILNIHPRLAGPLPRWRELFELAASTGFNAVWLNPFHRTTEIEFEERGELRRRSLYAIADHGAFDLAVTCGDAARDRAELAAAIAHAGRLGVRVMVDLVVNHVALDHPLVLAEDARLAATGAPLPEGHLFTRNARLEATDFDGGTGYDNAQLDYASPAARRFFLGEVGGPGAALGHWKQLLDEYLALGVSGFRCDMAYSVPAGWWRELVGHARRRDPGVVFLAETLGGKEKNLQLAEATLGEAPGAGGRPAFELCMLSTSWWDLEAPWLLDEIALSQRIARHGGTGSPDNHDLEHTLAQRLLGELRAAHPERGVAEELQLQRVVAALCVRNYAVAALVGSSVYTTASYLFCLDQSTVFWQPELCARLERERAERAALDHPLNLRQRILEINDFLRRLPLGEACVELVGPPRPLSGQPMLAPSAGFSGAGGDGATDTIALFEVLLRHAESGRLLGELAVAVDRSYEVRGAALPALAAAVAGQAPRLVAALEEPAPPPGQLAPYRGEARWLETPLLAARYRAAPSASPGFAFRASAGSSGRGG